MSRRLIVNADDLGQDEGISAGILRAGQAGIVTSASLMVRWPGAPAAARAAIRAGLSVGLHVDLGEWCFDGVEWRARYEVVDQSDAAEVRDEVGRQVDAFRAMTGRDPTHLDSHQHVHRTPEVGDVMREVARRLSCPMREASAAVRYEGGFYGQTADGTPYPEGITATRLAELLDALTEGVTELGCHPGIAVGAQTDYRLEREVELATLCDPAAFTAIRERSVELVSFLDL
jgi:chitin disaccharide deacetylase